MTVESPEYRILKQYRNIAVVGISSNPERYSNHVAKYLMEQGYTVFGINPNIKEVFSKPVYPDLRSVPEKIEIVDVFRNPDEVMPIVEQAIEIGAKVVWMQEDVVNEFAADRARKAGLDVIMDECIMAMHRRMVKQNKA